MTVALFLNPNNSPKVPISTLLSCNMSGCRPLHQIVPFLSSATLGRWFAFKDLCRSLNQRALSNNELILEGINWFQYLCWDYSCIAGVTWEEHGHCSRSGIPAPRGGRRHACLHVLTTPSQMVHRHTLAPWCVRIQLHHVALAIAFSELQLKTGYHKKYAFQILTYLT